MKKTLIVCGCSIVIRMTCVSAESSATPSVGVAVTSSAHYRGVPIARDASKAASSGSVAIAVTPVLLPNINSPSWAAAADAAIADAQAGTLSSTAIALPTQYEAITDHMITWQNLIVSTSTPMWDGMLNPVTPFNNELGGPLLWWLVDAQSLSGSDSISLSELSLVAQSSDGNVLGSTVTFAGDSYTPRAICIQAGGTVVSSGPDTVQGKRVLVLIETSPFNGGDTQSGINQVQSWVNSKSPYKVTVTAQVVGDDSTKSQTFVSTAPSTMLDPLLVIANGSGSVTLSMQIGQTNVSYRIWSSPTLSPANWTLAGIINGTNSLTVPSIGTKFFRSSVQ